ncbi:hypothetical protein, partial [Salmonella enterica]|uniref:hypothetical protein n=1 Tax=Salmonella enterica TaxID=28901 RepID=UPI003D2B943D
LVPEQGLILFTQSLSADDVVRVTIIRKGAYISNTGTIPHLEIPNSYLVATNATTTLTKALAPTDTTITVADTHALPVTTTLVEIHSASNA